VEARRASSVIRRGTGSFTSTAGFQPAVEINDLVVELLE